MTTAEAGAGTAGSSGGVAQPSATTNRDRYTSAMSARYKKGAGKGQTYIGRAISSTREAHISKKMTALLRRYLDSKHWSPDSEGFVFFSDLKHLLNSRGCERAAIETDEVIYVVANGNRFEILLGQRKARSRDEDPRVSRAQRERGAAYR